MPTMGCSNALQALRLPCTPKAVHVVIVVLIIGRGPARGHVGHLRCWCRRRNHNDDRVCTAAAARALSIDTPI